MFQQRIQGIAPQNAILAIRFQAKPQAGSQGLRRRFETRRWRGSAFL
jgi:hypothetical protein